MLHRLRPLVATALALVSLVLPGRALAQDAQVDAPAMGKPPGTHRWSVARDLAAVLPLGPVAVDAGPMLGPLVRLGYQATPRLEVGMRSGYLYGLDKDIGGGQVTALSAVPIVASARWFFAGEGVGPYVAVEIGANLLRRRYRTTAESGLFEIDFDAKESRWTAAANAGAGWVLSRKMPIDLRAHVAALDLVSAQGPTHAIAVGATAGWTIFF